MKQIKGGVCAAQGFVAGGIHCGIKQGSTKKDIAIIFSETECSAASVYTHNKVKAAPIYVTMEHMETGTAHAIVVNSGNANACAPHGIINARRMCKSAANVLGIKETDVIVASTGVIGQGLDPIIDRMEESISKIFPELSATQEGSQAANAAIMTTDTVPKEIALSFELDGKTIHIGGIAKGSGMIEPNMGTMLSFITTDCVITSEMLAQALQETTAKTFNRVSVDGDTSTNDMCSVLASGLAGNAQIEWKDESYYLFAEALKTVCTHLAREIARDGEGATKLITCNVINSRAEEAAEKIAKSVISSSLVKTAMFGSDANWGRVLCAMGYSKAPFRPEYVNISFSSEAGSILVCENGIGLAFDETLAKDILTKPEVVIEIDLAEGTSSAQAWGCDMTYDYVKINGDYRT